MSVSLSLSPTTPYFGETVRVNFTYTHSSVNNAIVDMSGKAVIHLPDGNDVEETFELSYYSSVTSKTYYRGTFTLDENTYLPLITTAKSVKADIYVYYTERIYQNYQYKNYSRNAQITCQINFKAADYAPTLATGAFGITPNNTGISSGLIGYIAGYSTILASFDSSKVTLADYASIEKWQVAYDFSSDVNDVSPNVSSYESVVVSGSSFTVTCTLVDSRGFTASQTFTGTITPYQKPVITGEAFRSDASGTEDEDGLYLTVDAKVLFASVAGQNSISATMYYKRKTDASYPATGVACTIGSQTSEGTNIRCPVTLLYSGLAGYGYNVKVTVTDALGNESSIVATILPSTWIMQSYDYGEGFAIGRQATIRYALQIPSDWEYYVGDTRLIDIIYPVGSIYMSVNNVSPAVLFGGTWERIAGKFLLAASDTDGGAKTAQRPVEAEGGSADAVVPYHNHTTENGGAFTFTVRAIGRANGAYQVTANSGVTDAVSGASQRYITSNDGTTTGTNVQDRIVHSGHKHTVNYAGTSGNAAGANMPPYMAVYMWKRTA